ncbi:unnamed protein product [Blepharisma stoltei]|uniref:Galactose oxidase n=1 Tax=Blepharisma stoltei TaxID=1481888 RepID=A0AAU9IPA6_9CILI|nr:unnamed protein product [Blepharisma stoltei]
MFLLFCLSVFLCDSFEVSRIPPTSTPPPKRQFSAMDYDKSSNSLLIFGGNQGASSTFNDVWKFSLNDSLWTNLVSTTNTIPSNN